MNTSQPPFERAPRLVRRCGNCIHFGELKGIRGTVVNHVCLAPVTSEPPPNGVTAAKHRFVYVASANGECELYTPNGMDEGRRTQDTANTTSDL